MKWILFAVLGFGSMTGYADSFEVEIDLNEDNFKCEKNMASAQNIWEAVLVDWFSHPDLLYKHKFAAMEIYELWEPPSICDKVESLQGQTVKAIVEHTERFSYISVCTEGGAWSGCRAWDCYEYHNEFVWMNLGDVLEMKSNYGYDQNPRKVHTGPCNK